MCCGRSKKTSRQKSRSRKVVVRNQPPASKNKQEDDKTK
jgi:hypothetical protein